MTEAFKDSGETDTTEGTLGVSSTIDTRNEAIAYWGATLSTIDDDPALQAATELRPAEIRGRIVGEYRAILDELDEHVPPEQHADLRTYILDQIKTQQERILAEHEDSEL